MASFRCLLINAFLPKSKLLPLGQRVICSKRYISQSMEYDQEKDPAPYFFQNEMQDLLENITRIDLGKVFSKRKLGGKRLEMPTYKFMSEDQLEIYQQDMLKKAKEMLQIPPVVKVRTPINNVLCKDDALKGIDTSKLVFTDITFGVKNSKRLIVIRDTDGTLREADWETKDRMNQIYFPIERRKLSNPQMFEEPFLKKLLDEGEYLFVLDKACLQFEPDSKEFQRITSLTYQHINEKNAFESLRSTRHFGSMAFFLSWFKIIDNLLLELLDTSEIDEAVTLVKIYAKIHKVDVNLESNVKCVEMFIKNHANKKGPLELAFQAYLEKQRQQSELKDGIKVAHGLK